MPISLAVTCSNWTSPGICPCRWARTFKPDNLRKPPLIRRRAMPICQKATESSTALRSEREPIRPAPPGDSRRPDTEEPLRNVRDRGGKLIDRAVAGDIGVESPVRRRQVGVLLHGITLAAGGPEIEGEIAAGHPG